MGYDLIRFVGSIDDEFLCSICSMVFDNPVETPCDHAFCNECITTWLSCNTGCPVDRTPISSNELKTPGRFFRNLLAKLNIKCDYEECDAVVELEHLQNHLTNCDYNPNSEIVCDKGCNGKFHRREQMSHSCIEHLSNIINRQEVEITNLSCELIDATEECRKLTSENEKLRQTITHRDEEITRLKTQEREQNNEVLRRPRRQTNDVVDRPLENVSNVRENSTIPLNIDVKWKIWENVRFCERTNILESTNGSGVAQSLNTLRTGSSSVSMEILSCGRDIRVGFGPLFDQEVVAEKFILFDGVGSIEYSQNIHLDRSFWDVVWETGDVIEWGIKKFRGSFLNRGIWINCYFLKNGTVTEGSFNVHRDHLFPIIFFDGEGTKVKILQQ